MFNLYDSKYYDISYRSILNREKILKLYTENEIIDIETDIEFDIKSNKKSSVDYFATAVLGSIVYNLLKISSRKGLFIGELEAKINLQIENPLTILNVRGYDEEPVVSCCDIKVYLYIDLDELEFEQFCENSLKKSLLYNTLKNTVKFNIKFIQIF